MITWTDKEIAELRRMRELGHTWLDCGKAIGKSQHTARLKGLELGLPRRISFGRNSGVRVVAEKLQQKERDPNKTFKREPNVGVAYLLAGLEVGEYINIEAPTSFDIRKIHRQVSSYGLRHDKGFRGRLDWRTRLMKVERVR